MPGYTVATIPTHPSTGTALTQIALIHTTTTRVSVNTVIIGPGPAAPVEQATDFALKRFTYTTTPAGTAVTPASNEGLASGALATSQQGTMTEGNLTKTAARLLSIGLHARANYQWYAYPGRERKSIIPASNSAGILLESVAASAAYQVTASLEYEE